MVAACSAGRDEGVCVDGELEEGVPWSDIIRTCRQSWANQHAQPACTYPPHPWQGPLTALLFCPLSHAPANNALHSAVHTPLSPPNTFGPTATMQPYSFVMTTQSSTQCFFVSAPLHPQPWRAPCKVQSRIEGGLLPPALRPMLPGPPSCKCKSASCGQQVKSNLTASAARGGLAFWSDFESGTIPECF